MLGVARIAGGIVGLELGWVESQNFELGPLQK